MVRTVRRTEVKNTVRRTVSRTERRTARIFKLRLTNDNPPITSIGQGIIVLWDLVGVNRAYLCVVGGRNSGQYSVEFFFDSMKIWRLLPKHVNKQILPHILQYEYEGGGRGGAETTHEMLSKNKRSVDND